MAATNAKSGAMERQSNGIDFRRFLIRPYGLAGTPWEWRFSVACLATLAAVFGLEIATPDAVVGTLGFLPVLAALWTVSNRCAWAVSIFALALLSLVVLEEPQNRLTIASIAGVGAVLGFILRVYASNLRRILAVPRRQYLGDPTSPTSFSAFDVPEAGVKALTRRELEVARLASMGYMSVEISQLLHISERTVESHLAHAYGKLGIHTRRGLVRMGAALLVGTHQPRVV